MVENIWAVGAPPRIPLTALTRPLAGGTGAYCSSLVSGPSVYALSDISWALPGVSDSVLDKCAINKYQ